MKLIFSVLLCATLGACSQPPAQRIGDLYVSDVWAKATAPGAPVAGGYLSIDNHGSSPDRLLRVESAAAQRVELHQMSQSGGVARMREVVGGLSLPAGQLTELKPGAYHLMFIGPTRPFVEDAAMPATLVFEKAGALPVVFAVRGMTAGASAEAGKHH